MFHISNGDDRWRVVRERKVGDAVFFFHRTGLERDKRGKDGRKYGVLKWGMCACKSELLRSSLQLPNRSVSDEEGEFSTLLLSTEGLGAVKR